MNQSTKKVSITPNQLPRKKPHRIDQIGEGGIPVDGDFVGGVGTGFVGVRLVRYLAAVVASVLLAGIGDSDYKAG